jgi:hypothetical protein
MSSHSIDRSNSCILCQENHLVGFENITPGHNLEFDPTFTAGRTDTRPDFPDGSFQKGDSNLDPGVTARWGMTSNLALNGTLNPDFSQVEADAAQLDVNTRFALFFPEKRPFFLEGTDFFSTPLEAVFTRTVVDPAWGIKLTGKQGGNGIGVFATRDDINNLLLPSNQESAFAHLDQNVTGSVLRYRRDVGSGSILGVLYTGIHLPFAEQSRDSQFRLERPAILPDIDNLGRIVLAGRRAEHEACADIRFSPVFREFCGCHCRCTHQAHRKAGAKIAETGTVDFQGGSFQFAAQVPRCVRNRDRGVCKTSEKIE